MPFFLTAPCFVAIQCIQGDQSSRVTMFDAQRAPEVRSTALNFRNRITGARDRNITAAMLEGWNNETVLHEKDLISQGRENVLFLPSNMGQWLHMTMLYTWWLKRHQISLPTWEDISACSLINNRIKKTRLKGLWTSWKNFRRTTCPLLNLHWNGDNTGSGRVLFPSQEEIALHVNG